MATETSNIDDLLISGKTATQPETPEHHAQIEAEEDVSEDISYEDAAQPEPVQSEADNEPEAKAETSDLDDYGNPKAKPRTYTEDEVNDRINKAIRDRLSRMKGQEQALPSVQQVQQAQQGFEYNPESEGNWQQQLESFVEQTFNKINQRQVTQAHQQREAAIQQEFQEKFTSGMERFQDFRDVVGAQPITDAMTHSLRGIKDPTAFIYAASKRHPQELQRISQLNDSYAQVVEMGKLEERMRKTKVDSKAPRPVSRTMGDAAIPYKNDKEPSIEELIAKADAKRRAQLAARRGRG